MDTVLVPVPYHPGRAAALIAYQPDCDADGAIPDAAVRIAKQLTAAGVAA